MTVELTGPEFLSAAAFVAAVREMPEIADAVITTTVTEEGEYRTTVVLTFNADALAQRFAVDQQPNDDANSEDDATGDEPVATPTPTPTEGTNP